MAKMSARVLKEKVSHKKHYYLQYDGSTQYQFANMITVVMNLRIGDEVKPVLLDEDFH